MAIDFSSADVRQVFAVSGDMAAGLAGNSDIFQVRWTSTTQKLVIPYVRLSAAVSATAFTAGNVRFSLVKVEGWTVDGTGGSTITLTGNNGKNDSSITGQTTPGIRVATTAALTGGTRTVLENIGGVVTAVGTGAGERFVESTSLFTDVADFLRPIVLNANEGVIIRATVPATGVWRFGVDFGWGVN